ncbi:hypothetical protein C7458_1222 [Williamsia muralis]|jgi:mercuric ion transport protein|nr:hypothetical protein C7458_1222 [Williamsia marianensis]PZT91310.1 MAG: hypothetical protein DI630_29720 [Gordonia sp. (in: high G+C Gram-positive bacteria)]
MSPNTKRWRGPVGALTAMIGACAACCAGPLLAFLGGLGLVSTIGAVWIPALIVVAVVSVGAWGVLRRSAARSSCTTPRSGEVVDLDDPVLFPGPR